MHTDALIFCEPVFHNKIWGGRNLESFGYEIPEGSVGECWALSAHPHGDCRVVGSDTTLSALYASHPELFGNIEDPVFPLLIKIIDAQDDLSIQVHPDDMYAATYEDGSLGKRECWYILDAKPGATIIVGQHASSADEFKDAVEHGAWSELLHEIPIQQGDFLQIDPGCVHAIKAGTLILETQQSSDITYRVYDYDRVQDDGSLRELHLDKSLEVINYDLKAPDKPDHPQTQPNVLAELIACESYVVNKLDLQGSYTFNNDRPFVCVSVIEGTGKVNNHDLQKGDHFILTALCDQVEFTGAMTLILSSLNEYKKAR